MSLAAKLKADYLLINLTPDYPDANLDTVASLIAADLIDAGAPDNDTDLRAVSLGVQKMRAVVDQASGRILPETMEQTFRRLDELLMEYRAGRIQEAATPQVATDD